MNKQRTFTTALEKDRDGIWWYVHVPIEVRQEFKALEHRGIIYVRVTIGSTSWNGSMLPWANGSAQVSVNEKIRSIEALALGQNISVTITPR